MTVQLTETGIHNLLRQSDKAVARALLVLHANQTRNEQVTEQTRLHNNIGFRPCHARMGSSMAKFYQRNGYLSPKQLAYWRREGKQGMRIGIYWRQLIAAAQAKRAGVPMQVAA